MIEGKRRISWSVHKLQSEVLPIINRSRDDQGINKYQLPTCNCVPTHLLLVIKPCVVSFSFLWVMIVFKRFITTCYLLAAVAINLKSISTASKNINVNSHDEEIKSL